MKFFKSPGAMVFVFSLLLAFYVGKNVSPTWSVETITLDVQSNDLGQFYYKYKGKDKYIDRVIPLNDALLRESNVEQLKSNDLPYPINEEFSYEFKEINGITQKVFYQLKAKQHWKYWSLLPAIVAILLCWILKEPIPALLGGTVAGALLLGKINITEAVFVEGLATKGAAGIVILYLWLLGGLMGVWRKTGAAQAFAEWMTKNFVRGPRSAKLVSWGLGIIFFQGGTISTALVGTTVKPLADKEKVSHEELSYIVDSTASPIAILIPFNAWPLYVQAFIFVAGVPFLLTEADRIGFFMKGIMFSFYAIFAIIGTFLLSIDKAPILGKKMRAAIKRSRETGRLDDKESDPLTGKDMEHCKVPTGYKRHVSDFLVPLGLLIGTAVGTFVFMGSPQVRWAFGLALLSAIVMALVKGMSLKDLIDGINHGLESVVVGAVILMFAILIGTISKETGGGLYLVELLGNSIHYTILPLILQLLTMFIAFSTGTSWGTYAVAFPLAMPLAWAVAQSAGVAHPELYMLICFATVLNGSVYGDQCSPISDTTILSSMFTGCDLMDHVKTQIVPASVAAGLAAVCWYLCTVLFV